MGILSVPEGVTCLDQVDASQVDPTLVDATQVDPTQVDASGTPRDGHLHIP